jgi:hypothetical protein
VQRSVTGLARNPAIRVTHFAEEKDGSVDSSTYPVAGFTNFRPLNIPRHS